MTIVATKTCTKCSVTFTPTGKKNWCPACTKAYNRAYYANGLGAIKAREAEARAANPPPPATEKACTRCGEVQPLEAFTRNKRISTGADAVCKACRRAAYAANPEPYIEQVKKYYQANKDVIREKVRERHLADPELHKRQQAESYLRNRETRMRNAAAKRATPEYAAEAAARTEAWRRANPERAAESARNHRLRYPERRAAAIRAWLDANPDKVRAAHLRRAGHYEAAFTIPFSAEQLRARLAFFGHACWMCGKPYEHVDHVKPISKGGANILANFRPACASCNLSKKDKWFGVTELHRFIKN